MTSPLAKIKISQDVARRQVSVFAGEQIANLLYGETPRLVFRDGRAFWCVPVALSTATHGRIGVVGEIEVDAVTGELCFNEETIQEIKTNAQRLVSDIKP